VSRTAQTVVVRGGANEPSARLMAGWLSARLHLDVAVDGT
jgi:hypothetical protein